MLTPFKSRVRATVTPVRAQPQTSGIGEAFTMLGRTAGQIADNNAQTEERVAQIDHTIAMRERDRADDDLALSVAVEQAKAAQRLRVFDEENQNAADYETRKAEAVDKELSALRGMIGNNDRVNKRFLPTLTTFAETEKADAVVYATRVRAKATGEQFEAMVDTAANLAYTDPAKAQPIIDAMIVAHRGRTDIPDALKPAIERKMLEPIRVSQINGAIDGGRYDAVEKELKAGTFDTVIGPEQKNRLLDRIEVERRAAVVAAEQLQADARTEARNAVKAVEEKVKLGINPTQAEIAQVRNQAIASGLPKAEIIGLDGMGAKMSINRQFNPEVDPMGIKASAAATRLGPKVAAGTATEMEQVSYAHLKEIGDSRAKARGAMLKETAAQGIAGQASVLAQLRVLPAEQRYLAAEEAKAGLGQLAMLGQKSQQYALEGREVRNARKDEFGKAEQVKSAFDRRIGGIKASLGGEYDNIMGIAWDIYAGELNGRSASGWNEAQFDVAVKIALGATKRDNGILQGGVGRVRGKQVILPDWKTPEEFDKTLSTLKFAGAVYANGAAASKSDILTNYRPEFYSEDAAGQPLYRFIDPSGKPLRHKDGSIYNVVVTR
jgi:hypothetical protein